MSSITDCRVVCCSLFLRQQLTNQKLSCPRSAPDLHPPAIATPSRLFNIVYFQHIVPYTTKTSRRIRAYIRSINRNHDDLPLQAKERRSDRTSQTSWRDRVRVARSQCANQHSTLTNANMWHTEQMTCSKTRSSRRSTARYAKTPQNTSATPSSASSTSAEAAR